MQLPILARFLNPIQNRQFLLQIVPASALAGRPTASRMARLLCDEITTERFTPVAFVGGSELILQFDEHVVGGDLNNDSPYRR